MTDTPTHHESPESNAPEKDTESTAGPPARKKRRAIRVLAILLVVLVIFLISIPWIASWPPVSHYVLSIASNRIRGDVRVKKVSLRWFGPTEMDGLEVRDPQNRSVIQVHRIELASGVVALPNLRRSFGELVIHEPRIVLYLDAENRVSIADSFAPKALAVAAPTSGTTDHREVMIPQGAIKINNGTIEVSRGDGGPSESFDLSGEFNVRSLNDIEGLMAVTIGGGSRLTGELSVKDLAPNGKVDVQEASGTVKLIMDKPASIGPIAEILLHQSELQGEARLALNAQIAPNNLVAEIDASVSGLQSKDRALQRAAPLDAAVRGTVSMADRRILSRLSLSGTPGRADINFSYQMADSAPGIALEELLAAALGGEPVSLPDFSMSVDGNLDLAAFDKAVPGLIPLESGQSLTGGHLKVTEFRASGGATPEISGSLRLTDLAAKDAKGVTRFSPLSLDLGAALRSRTGLVINRADLTSAPVTIQARGSISELRAKFQSDLAKVQEELGRIVDLGGMTLAGQLDGTLELTRATDSRIGTTLDLNARQLRYAVNDRHIDMPAVTIKQNGSVSLQGRELTRIEAESFSAEFNSEMAVSGRGWFDPNSQAFSASVNLSRADIGALARRAATLGVDALQGYGGHMKGDLSVNRDGGSAPMRSAGMLVGKQVTSEGRRLSDGDVVVSWSDLNLATNGDLMVQNARLDSDFAKVDLSGIRMDATTQGLPAGAVQGSAELEKVLGVIAAVTGESQSGDLRGKIDFGGDITPSAKGIKVAGTANMPALEVKTGEGWMRESVQVAYDVGVDVDKRSVIINTTHVSSKPMTLDVSGAIREYDSDFVASLRGSYDLSWKELTGLLHAVAPSTKGMITVAGTTKSDFALEGPLHKAGARPAFHDARSEAPLGWQSAEMMGIKVGPANFRPRLANGQISLPPTRLAAAQGSVQLTGSLDLRSSAPTVRIPGKNQILDGVNMTPELTRELLSRINPIFYQVASAQGLVYLTVNDLVFPLGEAEQHMATGDGRLELVDTMIEAAGLLRELLALGGITADRGLISVGVRGLDFDVKDGRIRYQDFTLMFPGEFDMKFYGSVGLDSTLDLVVSIPVRIALLQRLGVSGSAALQTRRIAGERVDIPIVGTREKPILDLKRIDKKKLLDDALKRTAGETIEGALQGLLGGDKDKKKGSQKEPKRKKRNR